MRFQRWLAAAAAVACLAISVPSIAVAQTSQPAAPTTHSYDDSHTSENRSESLPALWIFVGAVGGLALIATLLSRHNASGGRHSTTQE